MTTYYPTIGLEIHAELKTASKMFCGCKNDPDETRPNANICPVCMAHPGTLPVPNKQAMEHVVRVGLAIGGTIADFTEFDRKNYFYPDIPKGYQISQYKYPIVSGGKLAGMDVTRIHLEEDTATSKHDRGDFSLIDFNRAGVPLMELVTEPHTFDTVDEAAKTGGAFGREYQLLLQYLGVSEANMEKGEMRVEANISISPDRGQYGTKVEVKNLNSFKSAERAIRYELERMRDLWEEGRQGEIVQETRGWDEQKGTTFSQRAKEGAADYRYFPDPDIPKYMLSEMFNAAQLKAALPELPSEKRERYAREYGIKAEDIESYVNDHVLAAWFETVAAGLTDAAAIRTASNYITNDLLGMKTATDAALPDAGDFAALIRMNQESLVNSAATKKLLAMLMAGHTDPKALAQQEGLLQKNDEGALKEIAAAIIAANEKVAADYKAGKEAALQALVGQMMRETKGSANPGLAAKILKELLA